MNILSPLIISYLSSLASDHLLQIQSSIASRLSLRTTGITFGLVFGHLPLLSPLNSVPTLPEEKYPRPQRIA